MSTTTSATAATSTCATELYAIPIKDAACAMPKNSTYLSLMESCCNTASIVSYADCDYYCLAEDQTIGDLAECLIQGSEAGQVWCNTNANATATAGVPTTGAGTVVATATASGSGSGSGNASVTSDAGAEASTTDNAAVAVGMSAKGVGMFALLVFGGVAQALV
ncbi:hypothetical protein BJX99DRAFT_255846 [Aspergillus californicus]